MTKPILDSLPKIESTGLTAVSLFSGGGLMDLGVIHAGVEVIFANDYDPAGTKKGLQPQVVAYQHNIGDHILQKDVMLITPDEIPDSDIIVGGPPCQDFSVAGKGAGEDGDKGKLVYQYLRIIEAKKPKAFIFENVKGLTQKKHIKTLEALLQQFREIGYDVRWKVLLAWDYGVAQKRERVFIVGIRADLGKQFEWPVSEFESAEYRPVIRDAIGDLPEPSEMPAINNRHGNPSQRFEPQDEQNHEVVDNHKATSLKVYDGEEIKRNTNRPTHWDQPSPTIVFGGGTGGARPHPHPDNHKANDLTDAVYKHAKEHNIGYNPSPASPASTIRTKGEDVADFANHSEKDYWAPKSEYTYDQANRVQDMDAPSNTIPAHHNSGQPIHPTQKPRRFTVRECLRLQSVPDSYVLPDAISLSAMYKIVGNGVPSRLAYHLTRALVTCLQQ